MEPIQDDIETVRASLGLEIGLPELERVEAALDRLVTERDRLKGEVERWKRLYRVADKESADLEAERDRLLAGIGALVEKWRPRTLVPLDLAGEELRWMDIVCKEVKQCADELEALVKTTEEVTPNRPPD